MKLPLAKEVWPVVKLLLLFAAGFYILGYVTGFFRMLSVLCLVCALFSLYFFRDPEREIAGGAGVALSPADGKVFEVVTGGGFTTVKIFMSIMNVHVQRAPVDGKVVSQSYKPGKFMHAMDRRADSENEQKETVVDSGGSEVRIKQVAGIIARRIVTWVDEGEEVIQGQRIGMIKFGSQVDITVPDSYDIKVSSGQKVTAGITVIGEVKK